MPRQIEFDSAFMDFSSRMVHSSAVVASPTAAVETIIASITIPGDLAVITGVYLVGYASFTVGTTGANANLRIRRTDASGTVVVATGATTGGIAATNLVELTAMGLNASPAAAQVYVLTLTVGSATAGSTVSAVSLFGLVI